VGGEFKWRHFAGEVILLCVRWYCRYGISVCLEHTNSDGGVELCER
jgi:transposase-like protein